MIVLWLLLLGLGLLAVVLVVAERRAERKPDEPMLKLFKDRIGKP